ncbi:sulfotransferase family protein [Sphingomonas sp. RHCKR7]|uniref:sulfotransferase family 2 domain-containing protein n=1 Tax=Sphingomonas folli TaxID=2862497 RepID=UPI001C67AD92|nr:sulfotransferase family 2 domain-containing protein [Sphingomonas folli]MBW6526464.1 sulfotransferase family protein [Sphingomonas folli]
MIISYRHRFVFAAVPKTGTHAVRRALRAELDEADLEQVGLFVERALPWPELAALRHGHIALREVRPHLGAALFADFVKFAFVRNPFDRFVSYCAFMLRGGDLFERRPRAAMRHLLFVAPPEDHVLFQPQARLLVDTDGTTLLTDMVGRVEAMQHSYDAICARIGLASRRLERVNASRHGDYRRYYDADLADGVAARYASDLTLFGYDFDGAR